jgi:hypothetical protein
MPIVEGSGSPVLRTNTTSPSTVSSAEPEDIESLNPFSSGKRVKQKKNDKSDAILELMVQSLELKESELAEKKKHRESELEEKKQDRERLARGEEREQQLVEMMAALVKHIVQE